MREYEAAKTNARVQVNGTLDRDREHQPEMVVENGQRRALKPIPGLVFEARGGLPLESAVT